MLLPLAQHEAAPAPGERVEDVVADECVALLVLDEQAEQLVDRRPGIDDRERGLAHVEGAGDCPARLLAGRDLVSNRAALHGDDLLQPVAAVGGGGEAEEVTGRRSPDCVLEGERRQVVAFVDDDESVGAEERSQVVDRLEALDHCQVDDAGQLASAAASLPDLLGRKPEQNLELGAPLVEQWFAVGEDQGRQLPFRDQRACHHGLAAAGRGDEDAALVLEHRRECCLLNRRQFARELERQLLWDRTPILDREAAPGAFNRILELAEQAAREAEMRQVLVVAANQPRRLVG